MKVSVIICSYNPNLEILRRALVSIDTQTLPQKKFELVVVDNNSRPPIDSKDLQNGLRVKFRLIQEPRQGLLFARCTGISSTSGDLLVFVDDDNFLDPDYLETALQIAEEERGIGHFGGICRPIFEKPAPKWKKRLMGYLAVRDYGQKPITSHAAHWGQWEPVGAGMVTRREIAERFVEFSESAVNSWELGRRGKKLSSGEDSLLSRIATKMGYACSYQPKLKLSHYIFHERMKTTSIAKTVRGHGGSFVILNQILGKPVENFSYLRMWGTLLKGYVSVVGSEGLRVGTVKWFWRLGYTLESRKRSVKK